MSETKISKRYAKALFEFSKEQDTLDQIKDDMEYLFQLCDQSIDFEKMLNSPVIKVSKKMEIMRIIMANEVSKTTMRFLEIITKGRREMIIPSLSEHFLNLYNEFIGLKKVKLYSASILSESVKNKITNLLESQTAKKILLEETVQEELIGGFILRLDDLQFDASIKTKLAKLRNELSQQY